MRRLPFSQLSSLFRLSSFSHGGSSFSPSRLSISPFLGSDALSSMSLIHSSSRSNLTGSVQPDKNVSGCVVDLPQGDSVIVGRGWKALGAQGPCWGLARWTESVFVPYGTSSRCYHDDNQPNADTERKFESTSFIRGNLEEDGRGFKGTSSRWHRDDSRSNADTERKFDSTSFVRGNLEKDGRGFMGTSSRLYRDNNWPNADTERKFEYSSLVKGILEEDERGFVGSTPFPRPPKMENNADIVHFKLMRNNTFITVTDKKGNTKLKASAGRLEELKGGPKLSRYAAEAIAEYVGRESRKLGLKSVVMRVKGFTYFKKKKQAILSWRDGYTDSRSDQNPIVHIEDTTRRAHNGCRLPKQRRV